MVMFVMLYKVVLAFESLDEFLNCEHSSENYSLPVALYPKFDFSNSRLKVNLPTFRTKYSQFHTFYQIH